MSHKMTLQGHDMAGLQSGNEIGKRNNEHRGVLHLFLVPSIVTLFVRGLLPWHTNWAYSSLYLVPM